MEELIDFSKYEADHKLTPLSEPKPLLPVQRLFSDLVLITDEIRLVLDGTDTYVMALERLLTGKLTPTQEVAELNERLDGARSKLALVKESLQEIEHFLTSAMEHLPESKGDSIEPLEEDS